MFCLEYLIFRDGESNTLSLDECLSKYINTVPYQWRILLINHLYIECKSKLVFYVHNLSFITHQCTTAKYINTVPYLWRILLFNIYSVHTNVLIFKIHLRQISKYRIKNQRSTGKHAYLTNSKVDS